uniref:tyrosine-type recombinase/integrase n=1 Tax=Streptomyces sp. C10-9-1 TaxID=1859285 RepID=UPI003F4A554B
GLGAPGYDGATWLDLGRSDGQSVRIHPTGWDIRTPDPQEVCWRRTQLTGELPVPVKDTDGKGIDLLLRLCNFAYHDWKRLLEDAGVRDGRLHDARHTTGTVLMLLGVPDRVIDQIMGWEPGGAARMRARYLHVTDPMLKEAARKIERAIWGAPENPAVDKDQDNEA